MIELAIRLGAPIITLDAGNRSVAETADLLAPLVALASGAGLELTVETPQGSVISSLRASTQHNHEAEIRVVARRFRLRQARRRAPTGMTSSGREAACGPGDCRQREGRLWQELSAALAEC